jgi:hypothetical protein
MPTPTVQFVNQNSINVSAVCPVTTTHRIIRDKHAWIEHFVYHHRYVFDEFNPPEYRAGEQGKRDYEEVVLYYYPHKCYGCGSTYETQALLLTHLESVHGFDGLQLVNGENGNLLVGDEEYLEV